MLYLLGPYQVDYLGTRKVIDACVNTGVNKFVMVSSILANGLAAGQALNPQYVLLNTFGGVLFWKYKAESYLRDQSNVQKFNLFTYFKIYTFTFFIKIATTAKIYDHSTWRT